MTLPGGPPDMGTLPERPGRTHPPPVGSVAATPVVPCLILGVEHIREITHFGVVYPVRVAVDEGGR
ncbi:hypothetical protein GTS_25020 [Gandjariella thermophila]|uniref:Uncharacterized protein n=1 Tax=Gandjariella thermophila TaxID=1931992 RepID=A0A4D4J8Y0_9PSEU|nr:hypothetical protein GTS_25020 [Gandjariella thermophila]